jgi:hypothetical protein
MAELHQFGSTLVRLSQIGVVTTGHMYRMLLQSLAPVSLEDLINKADGSLYDALMESVREDIRIVTKKVELLNLISGQAREN